MHRIASFAFSLALALAATPSLAARAPAAAAQAAVETVGVYSNVRVSGGEDPHAEGYDVELYRENGVLFGLFYSSQGMVGDTPRGRLQDVRYDAASGKLSFRAKLTIGQEFSKDSGPDGRPSRDLFEFDGTLGAKTLSGALLHRSGYAPSETGERQMVTLKRDAQRSRDAGELAPASRAQWLAEPVPNGPQW
ncbi:hypothetical protein [Lysobacter enzymogenes]|uniref:hypothetical protein n=1 Tax=Lysobacter enzymogenes TaxID=69 RepID=UPI001AF60BD7|nr:hypothetical protein [Lysobacter enzymogenes]QQP99690.1 hypothetical protein JHW41_16405 [Lysobacter enzymogenes]